MKTKYIICSFFFTSLLLSYGSTITAINPDDKLVGDWSLIAEATPQGYVPAKMTIIKNEAGQFVGSLKSIIGNFTLSNLVLENGKRKEYLNLFHFNITIYK